jgi:ABC-type ATPase with predicted acetyltransferase domain
MADDLGVFLDDFSAGVAAQGIARLARRAKALLLVVSSHPDRIRAALDPDVVLSFRVDGTIGVSRP